MNHTLEQLCAGKLTGIRRLNLSCGLKEFPAEIFGLAETLEVLDLSGNALTSLPNDLPRLRKLRVLFCSDNLFEELPAVLGDCTQLSMVGFKANRIRHVPAAALPVSLRWLILTDNQIGELPPELGRCAPLQKLMLAGNQLQTLPEELRACTQLELLRIAANRFVNLPEWLFDLPRLAWLAYAGNPLGAETEAAVSQPIHDIAWSTLQIQQQLGEGASGVIHQAVWQGDTAQPVAVKLFKGALTSDGLPYSEMAGCIGAGAHPNLIPVHGRIHGHPAGASGLVMSLIDASFRNLAGPPSLDSCTRDVYSDDAKFTLDAVWGIAQGIAAAALHLHGRGIMHGDLYAHNILYNDAGQTLLGDFGAASRFALEDWQLAQALQRVEVRAFACLLEELLERCDRGGSDDISRALIELQCRCAHVAPAERPLFAEIVQVLHDLRKRS